MNLKRKSISLSKIFLFVLIFLNSVWAAGELDSSFNAAAYQITNSAEYLPMVAQPDGKLVMLFRGFGVNNNLAGQDIMRFNPDGTIDASFNAPRVSSGGIVALGLQSNGKILVRGVFTFENSPYKNIARLNTDGSIDTSFNVITNPLPNEGYRLFVQPDDSFFTGEVYKFSADGVPDNTFQYQPYFGRITAIAGLPDGKVYVSAEVPMSSGFDMLYRHNADGTRDASFTGVQVSRNVRKMIVLPDGKILIAGWFTSVNSTSVRGVARLNPNGSLDTTFNPGGAGASDSGVSDMVLLPDGKILIGGSLTHYNGVVRRLVARLNADGTLDTSFNFSGSTGPANYVSASNLLVLSDGKILVSSGVLYNTVGSGVSVISLNPNGTQTSDFAMTGVIPQRIRKVTVQSDGKIYVGGEFRRINGDERINLARLNPDGTTDSSFLPFFSTYSFRPVVQTIHQILVQPDGKVLVSFTHSLVMVRLNPDGSRDTSFQQPFSNNYIVYDFALQPDGKIIVVGENPLPLILLFARLNANGSLDTTFNPTLPNGRIYKVLIQPDGKSIICGEFTPAADSNRRKIARYNTDGSLDQSFNLGSNIDGNIYDIDLQADGKVVIGGTFGITNGNVGTTRVGRLNADGSFDTSFSQNVDSTVQTVKVQPDGKVLIGGLFASVGGTPREKLARLNSNGTLDSTFTASANALVFDINLQADGKVLVGGDFTKVNNVTKLGVARLNNSAPLGKPFDYDGDGKSDISVFRPSENKWFILKSSDSSVAQPVFGSSGDIPTPADFDGDGKTDPAVFRPSTGVWWYLSSINNNQIAAQWGQSGDIPRPSDFDGDGKADFIVYRPTENKWYRLGSTGTSSIVAFGATGDKPLIGDFDGDGKSDPAVYRPSTGVWWYAASSLSGAHRAVQFGISTDIPVPADFDGDGKTDFAVYRPADGVWHILSSGTFNYTAYQFGIMSDKPVAADYDGDGKADMAVYRASNGSWYQMRSSTGFSGVQWGSSNDIPTPNAFVP